MSAQMHGRRHAPEGPFINGGGIALAAIVVFGQPATTFLTKPSANAVRILTWNVGANSVFPPDGQVVDITSATRPAQFARVLRAVQPDIVCLQEVTASAQQSAALIDRILPCRAVGTGRCTPLWTPSCCRGSTSVDAAKVVLKMAGCVAVTRLP